MLRIGDRAPAFSAKDQDGNPISSAELLARGPLVVYFYPRDFTPGCTREACFFRDAFEELAGLGASIVGISSDDAESHRRFAAQYRLPFSLLSDPDRALAKQFGVMRAISLLGARRVTFVIAPDGGGTVRLVCHDELSMSHHVEAVRALLGQLGAPTAAAL